MLFEFLLHISLCFHKFANGSFADLVHTPNKTPNKNKNNDIFSYILNNKKLYNYYLNFIYFSKFNNNYLLNNSLIIQNTDTVKDLELKNQKSLFFLNKKGLMNYFNNNKKFS